MNVWAVLLAAVTSFLLGGLWYSKKVFGGIWNRANGGPPGTGHPAKVFGVSFVFALLAALAFARLLGPDPTLARAVQAGLLAGFGVAATSFGINYQFAQRPFAMWWVDAGYHTVQFVIFGLVLGLWH